VKAELKIQLGQLKDEDLTQHVEETGVLLDVTRLFGRILGDVMPTGVDRVTLAYVKYYYTRARAVLAEGRFVAVLTKEDSQKAFDTLLQSSADSKSIVKRLIMKARLTSWYNLNVLHERVLINTGHTGVNHSLYAIGLRKRGIKLLFMVHDVIPITHPEFCRPDEKVKHHKRIDNMLSYGDGIVTNSQVTLDTLQLEAAKLGIQMPSATVAHLAHGFIPKSFGQRPIETPYFVVLGTIEPRKNHNLLFRVWRKLVEEMGEQAPKLVLIGRRGWECENAIDILERSELLRGFIIEKSDCSDRELSTFLSHAQAMLFPTLVEGYGMPIIESLMVTTPVIASDLPVFHEIAGEIPDYLDYLDGLGWLASIKAYMDNQHPLRMAQLERIKHFEAPSWDSHFAKVDLLIDSLLADSHSKMLVG
jgi:glycosyltransferase involved in cell wall biosynthesis